MPDDIHAHESDDGCVLIERLAEAQGEMENAQYDSSNQLFRSGYASLASIVNAVRGPLSSRGLALTTRVTEIDHEKSNVTVVAYVRYRTASLDSGPVTIPITRNERGQGHTRLDTERISAMSIGGAVTSGRRIAIQLVLGLLATQGDPSEFAGEPSDVVISEDEDLVL